GVVSDVQTRRLLDTTDASCLSPCRRAASPLFPYTTLFRSELILEESLDQPLQAVALGDGRLAVWHAGPAPKLWIIAENGRQQREDRKSTRLNSSHVKISYAVFRLKKTKQEPQ